MSMHVDIRHINGVNGLSLDSQRFKPSYQTLQHQKLTYIKEGSLMINNAQRISDILKLLNADVGDVDNGDLEALIGKLQIATTTYIEASQVEQKQLSDKHQAELKEKDQEMEGLIQQLEEAKIDLKLQQGRTLRVTQESIEFKQERNSLLREKYELKQDLGTTKDLLRKIRKDKERYGRQLGKYQRGQEAFESLIQDKQRQIAAQSGYLKFFRERLEETRGNKKELELEIEKLKEENASLASQLEAVHKETQYYTGFNIQINKSLADILDGLAQEGHLAFLAGGYPRDHILDTELFDSNVFTTRSPEDIRANFKHFKQDRNLASKFHCTELNMTLECIPDKDYLSFAQKSFLRVNALICDHKGRIHDPLGVFNELAENTLLVNGELHKRLAEDPSRLLRLFRFSFQLNRAIPQQYYSVIDACAHYVRLMPYNLFLSNLNKMFLRGFGAGVFDLMHRIPGGEKIFNVFHPDWSNLRKSYAPEFKFIIEQLQMIDYLDIDTRKQYGPYAILALFMVMPHQYLLTQTDPDSARAICIKHLATIFEDCKDASYDNLTKGLSYWLKHWHGEYCHWLDPYPTLPTVQDVNHGAGQPLLTQFEANRNDQPLHVYGEQQESNDMAYNTRQLQKLEL